MQRRNTRQRKLILEVVRSMNDHPTADEIYLAVHERDEHIGRGTVVPQPQCACRRRRDCAA